MINRKQGNVFWFGFFAILACLVYPPYRSYTWSNGARQTDAPIQYRFLFSEQPDTLSPIVYKIDMPRLGSEFGGVVGLCGIGYWLCSSKANTKRKEQSGAGRS